MTQENRIELIDRIIDELSMALADAKDARDDIETNTFESCMVFHAQEAARLINQLNGV